MITRENFKELMSTIDTNTINLEYWKNNDYIHLQAHIFNTGGYLTISSVDYSEELEEEANANGDILTDKDNFARLLKEFGFNYEFN